MSLPRLYPIVDKDLLGRLNLEAGSFAEQLRAAGVGLLQYRNKGGSPQEILREAALIRDVFAGTDSRLLMNDRADLAVLAEFGGVHVGQGDLLPEDAKAVVRHAMSHPSQERERWGARSLPAAEGFAGFGEMWVGVSTHNEAQVRVADAGCADYIAVGPVFATGTKLDAEPVIGLDGVRRARGLTGKPIVAIGGITRANARSVMEAGADSVAVISGLIVPGETVEKVARDFLEILG